MAVGPQRDLRVGNACCKAPFEVLHPTEDSRTLVHYLLLQLYTTLCLALQASTTVLFDQLRGREPQETRPRARVLECLHEGKPGARGVSAQAGRGVDQGRLPAVKIRG
jgi:hypothetical protein